MPLEKMCCSLELAKRLKELGVNQKSTFIHLKSKTAKGIYYVTEAIKATMNHPDVEWFAAPTAEELGEMLPKMFWSQKVEQFESEGQSWVGRFAVKREEARLVDMADLNLGILVDDDKTPYRSIKLREKNEVDLRAKMLIYLIENGLYEPTKRMVRRTPC